jgi:hypothetical protein
MAQRTTVGSDKVGQARARYGVFVTLIGVVGLVCALLAVLYWKSDSTGGTLLGIITSPIAAIVASYYGISVARAASEEAGAARVAAGLSQLDKEGAVKEGAEQAKEGAIGAMATEVEEAAKSPAADETEAAQRARQAADRVRTAI